MKLRKYWPFGMAYLRCTGVCLTSSTSHVLWVGLLVCKYGRRGASAAHENITTFLSLVRQFDHVTPASQLRTTRVPFLVSRTCSGRQYGVFTWAGTVVPSDFSKEEPESFGLLTEPPDWSSRRTSLKRKQKQQRRRKKNVGSRKGGGEEVGAHSKHPDAMASKTTYDAGDPLELRRCRRHFSQACQQTRGVYLATRQASSDASAVCQNAPLFFLPLPPFLLLNSPPTKRLCRSRQPRPTIFRQPSRALVDFHSPVCYPWPVHTHCTPGAISFSRSVMLYQLSSPLVDDRPIMNAVKYRVGFDAVLEVAAIDLKAGVQTTPKVVKGTGEDMLRIRDKVELNHLYTPLHERLLCWFLYSHSPLFYWSTPHWECLLCPTTSIIGWSSASGVAELNKPQDKIDFKQVYTEVTFAIGAQFIIHTQDDFEPIADLQARVGNRVLILPNASPLWFPVDVIARAPRISRIELAVSYARQRSLYTRDIIVSLLVAETKCTGLLNTHSNHCFMLITGSYSDKIDFKRVYTEDAFVIGSKFIRLALDESTPIADLQRNKKRIPYCQMWGNIGATANEQTSDPEKFVTGPLRAREPNRGEECAKLVGTDTRKRIRDTEFSCGGGWRGGSSPRVRRRGEGKRVGTALRANPRGERPPVMEGGRLRGGGREGGGALERQTFSSVNNDGKVYPPPPFQQQPCSGELVARFLWSPAGVGKAKRRHNSIDWSSWQTGTWRKEPAGAVARLEVWPPLRAAVPLEAALTGRVQEVHVDLHGPSLQPHLRRKRNTSIYLFTHEIFLKSRMDFQKERAGHKASFTFCANHAGLMEHKDPSGVCPRAYGEAGVSIFCGFYSGKQFYMITAVMKSEASLYFSPPEDALQRKQLSRNSFLILAAPRKTTERGENIFSGRGSQETWAKVLGKFRGGRIVDLRGGKRFTETPGGMVEKEGCEKQPLCSHGGVAERLARSPPTKANLVQSPTTGSPDFRKWESRRTMPLVGGFSRGSPVPPRPFILAPLHSHLNRPHRLSRPRR
ncbi:hypothetical protein PR048_026156 [Dryococelus australis]|uniref:Uncharacterized protein n=1 Tax=Dryococelus australis TaxID=614101 RepID=A0ABQ9GKK1_9NEOP|nr:hypothetical protein PR048_026156 [Dryococelus australis]